MKILLALLVTFSVVANDNFMEDEDTMDNSETESMVSSPMSTCLDNAKTVEEIAACDSMQETKAEAPKEHAQAPASH